MKKCNKCGIIKNESEFYKSKPSKDGLQHRCKSCQDEYNKQWKLKNSDYYIKYCKSDKGKQSKRKNKYKNKITVINYYSNKTNKCAECDVDDIDMLCIDHINNDGAEHNKIHKDNLYSWLITHGFPSGFQVLCANHNTKKENVRRREKINYINK